MSDPTFLAGQTLPAAELQDLGEYGTWTPVLGSDGTAPTLGSGSTTDGEYHRNGKLITVWFNIQFGTAGVAVGTGNYQIQGMPFDIDMLVANLATPGWIRILDSSGAAAYAVLPRIASTTEVYMSRTIEPTTLVTSTAPFTWAASDSLLGSFVYLGTT